MRQAPHVSNDLDPGAWLIPLSPRPDPLRDIQLVCIPWAGGDSNAFRSWAQHPAFPAGAAIVASQLPGRGRRMREEPCRQAGDVVAALTSAIAARVDGAFALFGHSMGALLAFEVAREIARRGDHGPLHVFVSGSRGPSQLPLFPRLSQLEDDALIAELRELGAASPEALDDRELMDLVLPSLRADFEICETYRYKPGPPLQVPVTAFGGKSDFEVAEEHLQSWALETSATCEVKTFAGGHFYLNEQLDQLLGAIGDALQTDAG